MKSEAVNAKSPKKQKIKLENEMEDEVKDFDLIDDKIIKGTLTPEKSPRNRKLTVNIAIKDKKNGDIDQDSDDFIETAAKKVAKRIIAPKKNLTKTKPNTEKNEIKEFERKATTTLKVETAPMAVRKRKTTT